MSVFRFKQFEIDQTNSPFKVGTDGVLVGALAPVENKKTILDIGTGTGLIALMIAQRSNAQIDAIELNEVAFDQARKNFESSPWNNQLTIHHKSLQEFSPSKKYDLIVSNPPFFQNSQKSGIEGKDHARHTETLKPEELIKCGAILLEKSGKLAAIYPFETKNEILESARDHGLNVWRSINIKPTPDKEPKRIYVEFSFEPTIGTCEELIIEEQGRHQYSEDYINLTKEFYLNL